MSHDSARAVSPFFVRGLRIAIRLFQALYTVARWIPARDRIVFLSRQSNSATPDIVAVRDELVLTDPSRRIVVLARKLNSDADFFYSVHLLRQVWHIAHSRNIVLDSYSFLTSNLALTEGTVVTQMWHAIGSFKRFGWDDIDSGGPRRRQLATTLNMHAGNTTVIASSTRAAANFATSFNINPERIKVSPLPRVDRLLDGQAQTATRQAIRASLLAGEPADTKILLVAPTIHSALVDGETIGRIATAGQSHQWRVLASYHPVTHPRTTSFSTADLLLAADAFVTDKSSMIYEAGLLGIPGFLWTPPAAADSLFAESYPSEKELRPLMVASIEQLFDALSDNARRTAAASFAANYVDVDRKQSATTRLAEIIANS